MDLRILTEIGQCKNHFNRSFGGYDMVLYRTIEKSYVGIVAFKGFLHILLDPTSQLLQGVDVS